LDNIAGPPVEGNNFFGRQADVQRLWSLLNDHDLLLLGPRRIGKTSVARAVMLEARKAGWQAVEINVASGVDEGAFLDKLAQAVKNERGSWVELTADRWKEHFEKIGRRIKGVKVQGPAGSASVDLTPPESADWTTPAGELLHSLARTEQPWLTYIDELPILLYHILRNDPHCGVTRVRRFLDWFRNDVRDLPGKAKVHWLISGSVGLDTLVQQYGMADTINSLNHQGLAPYGETEAHELLAKLADRYRIPLTLSDAQRLIDAIRWLQPYYLQLAFNLLRARLCSTGVPLTDGIDLVLEQMLEPGSDNDFHHWEGRLSLQLGHDDAKHALVLLDHAARNPEGERPEILLEKLAERLPLHTGDDVRAKFIVLRDMLQRDAYWFPEQSSGPRRYRFCLEPLRRWWLRRRSL